MCEIIHFTTTFLAQNWVQWRAVVKIMNLGFNKRRVISGAATQEGLFHGVVALGRQSFCRIL